MTTDIAPEKISPMRMPVDGQIWYLRPEHQSNDPRDVRIIDIKRYKSDIYVNYLRPKRKTDYESTYIKEEHIIRSLPLERFAFYYTSDKPQD